MSVSLLNLYCIFFIFSVFLQHWVNSILTYCKVVYVGIPKILFVATHKDKVLMVSYLDINGRLINSIFSGPVIYSYLYYVTINHLGCLLFI